MSQSREFGLFAIATISKYTITEILHVILENYVPFVIDKSDIPQFSDFNACVNSVPRILLYSGVDGISYQQMGYMLRQNRRSVVADKKYGENHMKTAALMGLCCINNRKAYSNSITEVVYSLTTVKKNDILSKLCLYIPFMQNYYWQGEGEIILNELMSILSETTRKRRISNCRTIINIIDKAKENELQRD